MQRFISNPLKPANSAASYKLGDLLGKIIERTTADEFACKIIASPKVDREQWTLVSQEVTIHRRLDHRNVALSDMLKKRFTLTEAEVCSFTRQAALACEYLHNSGMIHGDIKPANLLLNDKLVLKVADFGLATIIRKNVLKKKPCGTPNYMPPEMVRKQRYSFKVDVWSLGCVAYTMLVGSPPPFEAVNRDKTFERIKSCKYTFPDNLDIPGLMSLINLMLREEAESRPKMGEIHRRLNPADPAQVEAIGPQLDALQLNVNEDDALEQPSPVLNRRVELRKQLKKA